MDYSFISANSPEELVEILNAENGITYLGQPIVHESKFYQFILKPRRHTLKKNRVSGNLTRNNGLYKNLGGNNKPKRVLTNEQKAKMKAAKARREAERAAAAGLSGPLAKEPEGAPLELTDWEHDFGSGAKIYKRLDYNGGVFIYDIVTREYLGAYAEKTNKLVKSVPDPLA